MHAVSSVQRMLGGLLRRLSKLSFAAGILALLIAPASQAEPYADPSSYAPGAFHLSKGQPYSAPKLPVYQPPKVQVPRVHAPKFRQPIFYPTKRSHYPVYHYPHSHTDPSTRVVYLPAPPVFKTKLKVYADQPHKRVTKTKVVYRYRVKELHEGLCAAHPKALVYPKPSASVTPLGKIANGTKLHIKQCLLTRDGAAHWCSFDAAPNKTAWIPAKFLDPCPPW